MSESSCTSPNNEQKEKKEKCVHVQQIAIRALVYYNYVIAIVFVAAAVAAATCQCVFS